MYQEFKETVKQPTLMASLVGVINPVTILPILAFGLVGSYIYKSKKENQRLRTVNEVLQTELEAVEDKEVEPFEEPLQALDLTVKNKNMSDEELKIEMIRRTMSELGKRSAVARAKKKLEKAHENEFAEEPMCV